MLNQKDFYGINEYVISTDTLSVSVIQMGASVKSIRFMGKELVLGYSDLKGYEQNTCYIGAVAGRYANRIKNGAFYLDGTLHRLDQNNGKNHLHGGYVGTDKKLWRLTESTPCSVTLSTLCADGESGYPGNLSLSVRYTVEKNRLLVEFFGESDRDTVCGPTTHTYFKTEDGPLIRINAEKYIAVDSELIPTGEIKKVWGELDLTQRKRVYSGYDHCFVLEGEHALTAQWKDIQMKLYTDYPGLQLYTGDFLKDGFEKNQGFACEPEFFPDSPNRPEFPSPILKKGEKYSKYCLYEFESI